MGCGIVGQDGAVEVSKPGLKAGSEAYGSSDVLEVCLVLTGEAEPRLAVWDERRRVLSVIHDYLEVKHQSLK